MQRRSVLTGGLATLAAGGLARPALSQNAKTLRFVGQAALANPDPIWTTATVAWIHGHLIWDQLYGLNEKLEPKPQMVAGHELSSDNLTWRFTLREGLAFTDGTPVRPADCIQSIKRWAQRDGFGQRMMTQLAEMKGIDDRVFEIRLTKPYPILTYALGYANCFIMPERIAKTDAFTQINEYLGSGPFRFLKDEWISGASAAYAKNEKYVPRSEPIDMWSGGKRVFYDRVEWKVLPDPATSAAALQRGEVDWVEQPLFDLLPQLAKSPGVVTEVLDPLGALAIIAFNHIHPPFDNPKLLRALLPAIDQKDFAAAVVGEQINLARPNPGFFPIGSPSANTAGMEVLTGKRDLALAKRLIAESGYKGERIVFMSPSDQPQPQALAQVAAGLFKDLGLNVDYQSMDWGTMVSRRASKEPPDKGGWNCFCTTWGGISVSNPGSSPPLRGNGATGWFGWPTDAKMEALREAWFDAPDPAAQKKICEDMQLLAFQDVPYIPVGQWPSPTAHRSSVTGFAKSPVAVFWGVRPA